MCGVDFQVELIAFNMAKISSVSFLWGFCALFIDNDLIKPESPIRLILAR
jgi:hypothetical protein